MITIDSLTKKYGGRTVVDDISFTARAGRVTGFLGPNGAGKSTTMRMMVGLTRPTAGSVTFHGAPFASLPNPGREVGVMLDASAQHAGRTGREVLGIAQQAEQALQGKLPPGAELLGDKADPRQIAQTLIDTLGMLQQKTEGRLDADEQQLLDATLTAVRFPQAGSMEGEAVYSLELPNVAQAAAIATLQQYMSSGDMQRDFTSLAPQTPAPGGQ